MKKKASYLKKLQPGMLVKVTKKLWSSDAGIYIESGSIILVLSVLKSMGHKDWFACTVLYNEKSVKLYCSMWSKLDMYRCMRIPVK